MGASLNGFIKLHRKLVAWGWYQDYVVKDVFLHLLLTANFKDTSWRDRILKKGQVVIGTQKVADELGFSRQQVRTALNKLKSTNEITIEATNKFSIITIVNWEDYQSDTDLPTKKSTKKLTNHQPTNNQQITNNQPQRKNDKNIKKDKNRLSIPSVAEIQRYVREQKLNVNASDFYKHYKADGWKCNAEPIVDWKKLLHSWAKNELRTYASGYTTKNRLVEEKPAYLMGDNDE